MTNKHRNAQIWEIENAIKFVHLEKVSITVSGDEADTKPEACALWHQKTIDELKRLATNPDEWPAITLHLDTCKREDFLTAVQNLIEQNEESKAYVSDEANWQ